MQAYLQLPGRADPTAGRKRKIAEVEAAEASTEHVLNRNGGDLSFDDTDEFSAEYDDWEGLLPEDLDEAALLNLSPSQPTRVASSYGNAETTILQNAATTNAYPEITSRVNPPSQQSQLKQRNSSQEEEDNRIAEEERILADKYGLGHLAEPRNIFIDRTIASTSFANQHDQDMEPVMSKQSNKIGGESANASIPQRNPNLSVKGFTSGRGAVLAPPSELALQKAGQMMASPPGPAEMQGKNEASVDSDATATATSRSAQNRSTLVTTVDTPTIVRGRGARPLIATPVAKTTQNSLLLRGTTPRAEQEYEADAGRPIIAPLRFAPKRGKSLLANRTAEVFDRGTGSSDDPVTPLTSADDSGIVLDDTPAKMAATAGKTANAAQSTFSGFTTGAGGEVAMPSAEDVARAVSNLDAGMRDVPPASSADSIAHEQTTIPGSSNSKSSPTGGFTLGSGRSVAMPAAEDVERVARLMDRNAQGIEMMDLDSLPIVSTPVGFTSGRGNPISMPSKEALDRALARLDSRSGNDEQIVQKVHTTTKSDSQAVQHGEGEGADSSYVDMTSEVMGPPATPASNGRNNLSTRAGTATVIATSQTTRSQANPIANNHKVTGIIPQILNKPFRMPRPAAQHNDTPVKVAPSTPIRVANGPSGVASTASRFRRLDADLSMLPRNTPNARANGMAGRGQFKTPFKNGMRPSDAALKQLRAETLALSSSSQSPLLAKINTAAHSAQAYRSKRDLSKASVFDLYSTCLLYY